MEHTSQISKYKIKGNELQHMYVTFIYPVEAVLALGAHADALIPPGQTPWCVAQGDLMRIQGDELPVFPEIKLKLPIHHHTQPECV